MKNQAEHSAIGEWRKRAEKVISLRPEDFHEIPPAETQSLLRGLVISLMELETQVGGLHQAQGELEGTHKQYIELFDFAPVGYFNLDRHGVIFNANITGGDMLGVSRSKLVNTPFITFVEPQHYDVVRSYLKEIADTGQRLSAEVEMRRGDGAVFYAQLQTVPLYEKSSLTYRVSVADITDRKRVEKALQESEQRYRDLADLAPEIIFETDLRGAVTYANRKALASFGVSPEELSRGINIFEYVHPEHRNSARERFMMILQGGDLGPEEYMLLKKDGTAFPGIVHSAAISLGGKAAGVRGIIVDITERKRAEQALRESEKRFRSTIDNMIEGCVIVDFNWRYIYVNDAAARLGRRAKEERLGHTMMEVFPGIEKQDTFAHLQRSMETRMPDRYDTEFTFPEGNKAWFEVRAEPVPEGMLILYWDITKRKLAEQRLKQGFERLERIYGIAGAVGMLPIGQLMIEHRLIERVVAFLAEEKARMEQTGTLARELIEYLVDFFRTYADATHHGKEENILFKALAGKPLTPEHKRIMDELVEEHVRARKLVTELAGAKERWMSGEADALRQLVVTANGLIKLYPEHIEKEDKHFFLPSMEYFTAQEQDSMLLEFWEYDRQMVHQKYTQGVEALKARISPTS